jgi:hypothetical protein
MYKIVLSFAVVACVVFFAYAQPGTEIYLFDLKIKDDNISISNGRNITNRKGYDNQPFFHPDKPLVYFVSADSSGRTDIYQYNSKNKKTRRVVETHDKEYSPTVTPDGKFISCILQTDSGAQHLIKYPINGGKPSALIENQIVGYHAWMNNSNVALFVLPRPFTLHLINLDTGKDSVLAENIGRSLHRIPGSQEISFIQKASDAEWEIRKIDRNFNIRTITTALPSAEKDMAWTADGKILMSDETKIFCFDTTKNGAWREAEIKSALPLNKITRLAVNPKNNTIALVVSE